MTQAEWSGSWSGSDVVTISNCPVRWWQWIYWPFGADLTLKNKRPTVLEATIWYFCDLWMIFPFWRWQPLSFQKLVLPLGVLKPSHSASRNSPRAENSARYVTLKHSADKAENFHPRIQSLYLCRAGSVLSWIWQFSFCKSTPFKLWQYEMPIVF